MTKKLLSLIFLLTIVNTLLFATTTYDSYVKEGVSQAFENFANPNEVELKQTTEVKDNYLTSTLEITYQGESKEEKIGVLFNSKDEIAAAVAKQLQYDILSFFDNSFPTLDYIWKNRFSSISFKDQKVKKGDCFNLKNYKGQKLGILVANSSNNGVVKLDPYYLNTDVVGLTLEKRHNLISIGLSGGSSAAFLELFSKTSIYPSSYYLRGGLIYPNIIFGDLGLLRELPLNKIFDSALGVIKNANLTVYASLGVTYNSSIAFSSSYGVWYENRLSNFFAYRLRYDYFSELQKRNYGATLVFSF